MSYSDEKLETYALFGALTRPPMKMGVTLEYHTLNLMLSTMSFIGLGSLLYIMLFIPLHLVGWAICRYDPCFFKIAQKKILFLPNLPNQGLWGVRCYEPY